MVYTYYEVFFRFKKKRNSATQHDEPWEYYAQWNKPIAKSYMCDSMYMMYPEQSYSQKQKIERWLPRDWNWGKWRVVIQWVQSFSFQEEEVLVTGYTTVWIYLALLNCTFKNGQDGKFCVLYFTTIKNKSIIYRYGYKNLKKILANQVKQHIKRIIYHV